jgi:D-alanyl-D-alanine carboxypeptidase/D-alanyl-D-alanine-endopeptidase (penicillin-binding protein 4)
MSSKIFALLLLAALLGACNSKKSTTPNQKQTAATPNLPIDTNLQSRLKAFSQKPRVKGKFAFSVYDLTADKPVFSYNPTEKLPTASCLKLTTGIAALHLLTPQYCYETSLYSKGSIHNGIYYGTLTLKGSLDPQLQGQEFSVLTKKLKSKGVRKIQGKVMLDLLLSEPVKSEVHWYPWDLSFSKYGVFYKGRDRVKNEFKASLRNQGIAVADSSFCFGPMPRRSACLQRYRRPVTAVLLRMWKHSSNTQSTGLLHTIGHQYNPKAEPVAAGLAYLNKFMKEEIGCKPTDYVIHDGCGLCPYDQMTAPTLVRVLRYGYQHKETFDILNRMLPLSGVDGTLRREMAGQKTRGKIRAKTGTLSHPTGISSLAGYCTGGNGHMLCFSILDSEMSVLDARVLQRRICEELVRQDK